MRKKDTGHLVDWTPDGKQLIFDDGMDVMLVDAAGSRLRRIVDANPVPLEIVTSGMAWHAEISPDGQRIVYASCEYRTRGFRPYRSALPYERWEYQYEIATIGIDGSNPQRLTHNEYIDHFPSWAPDGRRVAFFAGEPRLSDFMDLRVESLDIADKPGGGSAPDQGIWISPRCAWDHLGRCDTRPGGIRPPNGKIVSEELEYAPQWSPDGRRVAFLAFVPDRIGPSVYIVAADGSDLQRISDTIGGVSWSPDGQRLALPRWIGDAIVLVTMASDGSDQRVLAEIIDAKELRRRQQARVEDWSVPWIGVVAWSPDGLHILFRCGVGVCVVDRAGRLVGQSPKLVPDERYWHESPPVGQPAAAWSPDGARIAVRTAGNQTPNGDVVLYTMAPDGSDIRVLVRGGFGMVAEHSGYQNVAVGLESCSQGFVVPEPSQNPGLVQDCETLIGVRDALTGDMSRSPYVRRNAYPEELWTGPVILNWSPGTPLAQWTGVRVGGSPPRVIGLDLSSREGIRFHGTHVLTGILPCATRPADASRNFVCLFE